jgi:hypothetical protein
MTRRMLIGLLSAVTGLFAQDAIGHKADPNGVEDRRRDNECEHLFESTPFHIQVIGPYRNHKWVKWQGPHIPVESCRHCGLLRIAPQLIEEQRTKVANPNWPAT